MKIPLLFCLFMLFVLWYGLQRSRISRKESEQKNQFWEQEDLANSTRKQDLSNLHYIEINPENFPLLPTSDPQLLAYQEELLTLSTKSIVNLTGSSNTELKLLYGAANLPTLILFDQNFTQLVRLLVKWATYLHELNHLNEAITILEFGIICGTDVSSNYTLLATLYGTIGTPDKINDLIASAHQLNDLTKATLLNKLKEIQNACF